MHSGRLPGHQGSTQVLFITVATLFSTAFKMSFQFFSLDVWFGIPEPSLVSTGYGFGLEEVDRGY
ncbi:MAG: hypothetical protein M3342_03705 [Bacteroidota bacterium]|nr:hypothetical protein [Bacteroidota bacterium]